jgi:metal transporter CNNM
MINNSHINHYFQLNKVLIILLYPVVYPLAKFLDWMLGSHHKQRFDKKDLKALIELHELEKDG